MATYESGVLRLRPRINVLRGYPGNEPTSITAALPVSASVDHSTAAKTIYSGQPIVRDGAGNFTNLLGSGWGTVDGADLAYDVQDVFFAYHDSTDTDVTSCGKLLGFSALGKFELETAWFDDTTPIAVGNALAINDSGVLVKQADGSSGATVGYVTGIRNLGVGGHSELGSAGIQRGGVAGTIPEDSTADPYDTGDATANWVVTFVTSIA
jgi:hypothetical protein